MKRPSGGKRAGDKRRAERAARESRAATEVASTAADWQQMLTVIGKPPSDPTEAHAWLAKAALAVVYATLHDAGPAPEQMRRDAMKQIEQASKVLDPAKLSEELAELEKALEELRDARAVETGEDCSATPGAHLS